MAIKVNDKVVAGRGKDGKPGKSAYDYAVDGGYTGTEAEFQSLIAQAQSLDGGPFLPLSGGTMSGDVSMGQNRLTVSAIPTADTDATNKAYVDSSAQAVKNYADTSIQSAILDSWAKAY